MEVGVNWHGNIVGSEGTALTPALATDLERLLGAGTALQYTRVFRIDLILLQLAVCRFLHYTMYIHLCIT